MVIWKGGLGVLHGSRFLGSTVTVGVLVAFMQYAQRFFRPIQDLSEKYNILQAAMAASERVFKLIDTEPEIVSPANARTAPSEDLPCAIEFRDVWFTYQSLDETAARLGGRCDRCRACRIDRDRVDSARRLLHCCAGRDGRNRRTYRCR